MAATAALDQLTVHATALKDAAVHRVPAQSWVLRFVQIPRVQFVQSSCPSCLFAALKAARPCLPNGIGAFALITFCKVNSLAF